MCLGGGNQGDSVAVVPSSGCAGQHLCEVWHRLQLWWRADSCAVWVVSPPVDMGVVLICIMMGV